MPGIRDPPSRRVCEEIDTTLWTMLALDRGANPGSACDWQGGLRGGGDSKTVAVKECCGEKCGFLPPVGDGHRRALVLCDQPMPHDAAHSKAADRRGSLCARRRPQEARRRYRVNDKSERSESHTPDRRRRTPLLDGRYHAGRVEVQLPLHRVVLAPNVHRAMRGEKRALTLLLAGACLRLENRNCGELGGGPPRRTLGKLGMGRSPPSDQMALGGTALV